jgi:hypothetical protein
MKIIKLRSRKVETFPIHIRLPKFFTTANELKRGDVIDIYLTEFGDLIIKKQKGGRK